MTLTQATTSNLSSLSGDEAWQAIQLIGAFKLDLRNSMPFRKALPALRDANRRIDGLLYVMIESQRGPIRT